MSAIQGLKWKILERGAQISVPAAATSTQEIKGILFSRAGLVNEYKIRLRSDMYRVTVEADHVESLQGVYQTLRT